MAENLFCCITAQNSLWNRQIFDIATLFATRVKYMKILQEQFAGLITFSLTRSTCISNIKSLIVLDIYKKRLHPRRIITLRTIRKPAEAKT